jgi:hypothetical protein
MRWLVLTGAIFAATSAHASPIIFVDDVRGQIGTVDVATGTSTVIGLSGVILTDIAFTSTGAMFGIDFTTLYSINQGTGLATAVGGLGVGGMNALVGNGAGLLAASNLNGNLYSVNTATGIATTLTGSNPLPSAGDLAFHGGFLYEAAVNGGAGTTDLLRISLVGNTFTSVNLGAIVNNTGLFGLVNASDGNLYGVDGSSVYLINMTTPGASSLVSTYGGLLLAANGAASPNEAAVPEPATLTLLGSGLLIAARRRYAARRK